ncbi:gliding motility-associated C-terminal domain-containing protein [Cesiribacter sp. SM1]|uniref:T9SS type B sorting domain-containing protein n=1 Tax=Cesiribacter sp. SM1 TaxID=2861196 RepID=UPI001CD5DC9B|nr:gliding motility-associated C-terminal domain-containing protein [Cesiribacter sp. SM1]
MASNLQRRFFWIFFAALLLASFGSTTLYAQGCPTKENSEVTFTPESCPNAKDGTATISIQGGVAPYAFILYKRIGLITFVEYQYSPETYENSYTFTGIEKGNYKIEIYDSQIDDCVPPFSDGFVIEPVGKTPIDVTISGTASVCENQKNVTYSVPVTTGSSYSWTVPAGATIVSGATGPENNTIAVDFGASSGQVTVQETNSGGCKGKEASFSVNVTPLPTSYALTASGDITFCEETAGASIGLSNSETEITYNLIRGGEIVATVTGNGGPVSFGTFNTAGVYTASAYATTANSCTAEMTGEITLTTVAYPNPPTASTPDAVCADSRSDVEAIVITLDNAENVAKVYRDEALTDLVASGITSFDPDDDTAFDITQAGTHTYYITQSNATACESEAIAVSFVLHQLPTASFQSSTIEVCDEADGALTVNLTGLQPFSVTYNNGIEDVTVTDINANTYTIAVENVTAGRTITLKSVSDANTCSREDLAVTAQVIKLEKPAVTLNLSATEACYAEGGTFVLDGGLPAGGKYYVDNVEATQVSLAEALESDKIYTIIYRYTDEKGCTNEASQQFTVHPLPVINFTMEQTVFCLNDKSYSLNALPAGGKFSGPGVSGGTFHPKNTTVGEHLIVYTYTDENGCEASASVTVTVNPMLDAAVTIAGPATICAGAPATFTVSEITNGGANPTYSWLVNGVEASTAETFTTTSLAEGDDVQLLLTQGDLQCGNKNTASSNTIENIKVNPLPDAAWTTTDQSICFGASQELELELISGTAPFSLEYSDGNQVQTVSLAAGENSITVRPEVTTIYTLTSITDANGCTKALNSSVTITVNPTEQLSVSISPLTSDVCPGAPVSYSASVTNGGDVPAYQWFLNGNPVGENLPAYTLADPKANDEVWVEVVQDPTVKCPGSQTSALSAKATVTLKEVNAAFSGPATVCISNTADFNPEVSGGTFSVVETTGATIDPVSGVFSASAAGKYTILYSITQNECSDEETTEITVTPAVDPSVTLSAPVTEACAGGSVAFTAIAENAGANPVFEWVVNGTVVSGQNGSTYTATSISGSSLRVEVRLSKDPATTECISNETDTDEVTITINQTPTVTLAIVGEDTICPGEESKASLQFGFTGTAPYTFVYSDGTNDYTIENITTASHTVAVAPTTTTLYSVVSLTDSKCAATSLPEAVEIKTVEAPENSPVVTALEDGCNSFSLSWAAVNNASAYVIEVATDDAFTTPVVTPITTSGTSHQVPGLDRGVRYFYRVTASNICNETKVSVTGEITLEQLAAPVAQQPAAANISCNSFQASWSAVAGATSYTVEIATNASFTSGLQTSTVAAPATTEDFTGLTANTAYYYRVIANAACGASVNSNEVEVTTNALQTAALGFSISPATVTTTGKLQVSVITTDAITNLNSLAFKANWADAAKLDFQNIVSSALTGANIVVDETTGSIGVDWTSATAVSLEAGAALFTLEFDAALCGEVNFTFGPATSATSGECPISITTINASHNIGFGEQAVASAATNVGCVAFTANWAAVTNATSYTIEIADNSAFTGASLRVISNLSASSYDATGLLSGTKYYYRVQAVNSCGAGPYSGTIEVITNAGIALTVPATAGVCEGERLLFNAEYVEGATYAWEGPMGYINDTHEVAIDNANAGHTGKYTLTVTKDGCTSVYEVAATVNPIVNPEVAINPTEALTCASIDVNLKATVTGAGDGATYTYKWYINEVLQISETDVLEVKSFTTGAVVRVEAYTNLACANMAEATITLIKPAVAAPGVEASAEPLCFGEAITASATGENIKWTVVREGIAVYTQEGNSLSYTADAAGTYTVSATQTPAGCEESPAESYTVEVKPEVTQPVLADNLLQLCEGTGATVTATGENVVWYSDAALSDVVSTTAELVIPADLAAGTYSYYAVSGVEGECTSAATTLTVEVGASFKVDLGLDVTLCTAESVELNSGYTAEGYDFAWSTGETNATITVNKTGTYSVVVTNRTTGCTATDEVVVTITDELIVEASLALAEEISCNTTAVTLVAGSNAGEGATYFWTLNGEEVQGAEGSSLSLDSFQEGDVVEVTVTSVLECATGTKSDKASITLNKVTVTAPVVSETTVDVCFGEAIALTATGSNIKWIIMLEGVVLEAHEGNELNYTPAESGSYSIEVTQQASGCPVSPATTVTATVKPAIASPVLAQSELTLCKGIGSTVTATGENVVWYSDEALSVIASNTASLLVPGDLEPAIYTYYAVSAVEGCSSEAAVLKVEVLDKHEVELGANITSCKPASVELNSGFNTAEYEILWSTGETGPTITVDKSGTYSVVVTNRATGCASNDDVIVNIVDEFTVAVSLDTKEDISCATTSVELQASSNAGEGAVYTWVSGGSVIKTGPENTLALESFEDGEDISVTVTSALSCAIGTKSATASIELNKVEPEAPVVSEPVVEVCANETIALTATGSNIHWSIKLDGAEVATHDGNELNYTPEHKDVTYTIEVTQQLEGCAVSPAATVTATVKPEVTQPVLADNLLQLCEGTGATVTATGENVVWYSDAALSAVVSNTAELVIPADLAAGTYSYYAVSGVEGECTSAATTLTVEVGASFKVDLGLDVTLCTAENVELNSGYTAEGYDFAWSTGETNATITVNKTGTYSVVVTNRTTGCTATDEVVVTITDELIVEASLALAEEISCNTTAVTLVAGSNAGEGATYFWTLNGEEVQGAEGSSLSLDSFQEGDVVEVTVTSVLECATGTKSDKASITLNKVTVTAPGVEASAEPLCFGEAITASATGENIKWTVVREGVTVYTYEGTSLSYTADAAGTYTVSATQTPAGCEESPAEAYTVEVKSAVAVPVLSHTEVVVCADEELPQISASGINISWYSNSELTQLVNEGEVLQTASLEAGETATYYAIAREDNCASEVVAVVLKRQEAIVVDLGIDKAACEGETVTLDAGYDDTQYEISWSNNVNSTTGSNATFIAEVSGIYTVIVTDPATRCTATDEVEVVISNDVAPEVSISVSPEDLCSSDVITLEAVARLAGEAPTFQWMRNGETLLGETASKLSLTKDDFDSGDEFSVVVTSSLRCNGDEPAKTDEAAVNLVLPEPDQAPQLVSTEESACTGTTMPIFKEINGNELHWYFGAVGGEPVFIGSEFQPSEADLALVIGNNTFYATRKSEICGESPHVTFTLTLKEGEACEPATCEVEPAVAVHILPGTEICGDITTLKLEAKAEQVGENATYAWFYNNETTPFSTEAAPTYSKEGFTSGDFFTVEVTIHDAAYICEGNNKVSDVENITIVPQVQATASIQPIEPVCADSNTPVVLKAEGTYIDWRFSNKAARYEWFINDLSVKNELLEGEASTADQLEIVPSNLPANAQVRLVVSLPEGTTCVLAPAEASYSIPFADKVTPSVSLNTPGGVCPGASITFTATPANAGINPVFTFLLDGQEVQSGLSASYVLSAPQNGQKVQVKLSVANAGDICLSATEATSDERSVTVRTTEECVGGGFNCGVFGAELTSFVRPSCGERNGALYYNISGNAPSYFIRYSFAGEQVEQVVDETSFVLAIERIPAGEVSIYMRDSKGNECSLTTVLESEPKLEIDFQKTADGDILCYGETSGKARLMITGGNAPYLYQLNGGEVKTLNGNVINFTNLPAGSINVLVWDDEQDTCPAVASVDILNLSQPIEIETSITQEANCNDNVGAFTLNAITGGIQANGFKVKLADQDNWQDFTPGTPLQFTGLTRGRQTLVIANGSCQVSKTVVVPSPGLIALDESSAVRPFSCDFAELRNGIYLKMDAAITQVEGPYMATFYKFDDAGNPQQMGEPERFIDEMTKFYLERGRYQVVVSASSGQGCPENRIFEIEGSEVPVPITFQAEPIHSYCDGSIGGVRITNLQGYPNTEYQVYVENLEGELMPVEGGVISRTDYEMVYKINGYWDVSGLIKGGYRVWIEQNQNICSRNEKSLKSEVIRIEDPSPKLAATIKGTTVSFPERATGTLTFQVTTGSGTAPYTSSLVWVDRIEGQENWMYESIGDEVPASNGLYISTYENLPPGVYELTVTDSRGCSVTITQTIDYDTNIFVPNIITPNGDGKNEVFYIRNKAPRSHLIITNRWGKVVYENKDYQNDWDGGSLVEGIYFYSIKMPNNEAGQLKGWLEIRRGANPN